MKLNSRIILIASVISCVVVIACYVLTRLPSSDEVQTNMVVELPSASDPTPEQVSRLSRRFIAPSAERIQAKYVPLDNTSQSAHDDTHTVSTVDPIQAQLAEFERIDAEAVRRHEQHMADLITAFDNAGYDGHAIISGIEDKIAPFAVYVNTLSTAELMNLDVEAAVDQYAVD